MPYEYAPREIPPRLRRALSGFPADEAYQQLSDSSTAFRRQVRLSGCRKLGPNLPPAVLGKRGVRQILSDRAGRLSKGTVDQDIAPAKGVKVRLDSGGRRKFRRRLDLQAGLSVPEKNRRQKDMQPIKLAFFEKP